MSFLLLLLLLLFFFPYLLLPVIIFGIIGFLFLLPYVLIFNSFYNVITIPGQIIKIAMDKRVRKNHSLEHATVNVLEERYGRNLRIGGLAYSDGFSISGLDLPSPPEVLDAAKEGYFRMVRGEHHLAIHPRCGTSMAAASFLFSLVFIIIMIFYRDISFVKVIIAFLLANLMAKPFGAILQKYFTTHPNVEDISILDIYVKPDSFGFPFTFVVNPNRTYFIKTISGSGNWFHIT